jgi:hypothetical protein
LKVMGLVQLAKAFPSILHSYIGHTGYSSK